MLRLLILIFKWGLKIALVVIIVITGLGFGNENGYNFAEEIFDDENKDNKKKNMFTKPVNELVWWELLIAYIIGVILMIIIDPELFMSIFEEKPIELEDIDMPPYEEEPYYNEKDPYPWDAAQDPEIPFEVMPFGISENAVQTSEIIIRRTDPGYVNPYQGMRSVVPDTYNPINDFGNDYNNQDDYY